MISFLFIFANSRLQHGLDFTNLGLDKELKNFSQITDHFNPNSGKFNQRYYEVTTNYVEGGPVILYAGGESDVFKIRGNGTDFLSTYAKDLGALVLSLEHRYFGESWPTETSTVEDYKYLTVDQALADLKYFQEEYSKEHHIENSKWLIVGGSYPGLLSALAREIYPQNFHAAISSSGVVLATDDYQDFDLQVAVSMGQECASAARHTRILIDQLMEDESTKAYVKEMFNASLLTDMNFRFLIGELFTIGIQYDNVELICGPIVDALKTGDDPVAALAKINREYFIPEQCDGDIARTYSDDVLIELANTNRNAASRSWLWMTCNELAYWQTASGRLSLRSPKLDKAAFQAQCTNVFGEGISPKVDEFNQKYGGLSQNATRVYYTTGSQDPWTWTCVTEESGVPKGSYAHTITGHNVGHCDDLHLPKDSDPIDLVRTRNHMREVIKIWMAENDE
ncbi:Clan SC, family S28, unassigned serine peptidase [Histomonas meleagridis]|uniref:Clan SC, family S28, unassigned serine peptidase n=1 Tax=Histomonas meleagridis TaxID=135588 RepID=UPI0035593951|nr:Clan SC, family S28, unassigned serine peptidase [Histomonas meleagridis]KAH0796259.1 Clan SC, family S28, unassigned serine peptidase [Histomonas meleagridis]